MRNASPAVLRLFAGVWLMACSVYEAPEPATDGALGTAGAGMAGTATSTPPGGGAQASGGMPGGGPGGGPDGGPGGGPGGGPDGGPGGGSGTTGGGGASPTTGGPSEEEGGAPPSPAVGGAAGEGGAESSQGGDGSGQGGGAPAVDGCPDDPSKDAPGVCGCGIPDVATPTLASCSTLKSKLVHRYDFEGSDTAVTDRVGSANGVAVGATLEKLDGRGVIRLGGGKSGAYVDLPNRLASSLSNATFEAWLTWGGGDAWQRIFDFGDSTNASPENNPLLGKTYLFVSPKIGTGGAAIGYSLTGNANSQEQDVKAPASLTLAVLTQVVAVVNDSANLLTLYVDGAKVAEAAWTGSLSSINDVNVWLGRSQYQGDPELSGVFHEFRVYDAALTAAEVATAFKAGTDPDFLSK